MDVEVPNGYYTKSCDDSQIGNRPSVLSNETNNVNTQLTYLISLVQEDGTSQIVQITDKEAHSLGIFPNNTVENNCVTFNETTKKDLQQPLKFKRNNFVLKQQKSINKTIKRKKVFLKKTLYGENNDLLSQQNVLHYTQYVKPHLIQLSEEQAKKLGVIPNSSAENGKILRIDGTNSDNTAFKQSTLSHSTILQTNGSSTTQFTKEHENTLGNFSNTALNLPRNGTIQNSDSVINYDSLQMKSRKVVNIQDILVNGNIKQCSPKITLVHYPPALLQEDNAEIVKLVKEKTTNLEFYVSSNGAISSGETNGAKPLGSCENPIEIIKDGEMLHSTQNLSQDYLQQIAKALQCENVIEQNEGSEVGENKSNIIYRVVYPEELDLNPKPSLPLKPLKRGRPKKKPPSDAELEEEEVKPMKNVRTRSGRITRPPKHIKQVFKKIDVSEAGNVGGDIKTIEFEPLKTNEASVIKQIPKKLNLLENHQRKRSIRAQFRCLKCQKAYLGHSKMLQHLQKHPDHGPIPELCKPRSNNDTWNFLIDLCNKNPIGQRGAKFCNELVNFWNNVRILAKVFFKKPVSTEKNVYYVDHVLSKVLDIDSGNYILNESELHKEIDVLSFIKDKNNSNAEDFTKYQNGKDFSENFDLEEFVNKCQTNTEEMNGDINFVDHKRNQILKKDSNDFANSINNITFEEDKINFNTVSNSNSESFNLKCDIMPIENYNSDMDKFNNQTINNFEQNKAIEGCNEIPTTQSTEQHTAEQSHSEISLPNDLLSENSLLNSLPNLRKSVEELILNNVDNSHVTNLLDNSTSSDEVMNVDQFVNERFKNLTETDLELPNTALNLDLPSLDLFQFHTS